MARRWPLSRDPGAVTTRLVAIVWGGGDAHSFPAKGKARGRPSPASARAGSGARRPLARSPLSSAKTRGDGLIVDALPPRGPSPYSGPCPCLRAREPRRRPFPSITARSRFASRLKSALPPAAQHNTKQTRSRSHAINSLTSPASRSWSPSSRPSSSRQGWPSPSCPSGSSSASPS